jgi:hypothetical protein
MLELTFFISPFSLSSPVYLLLHLITSVYLLHHLPAFLLHSSFLLFWLLPLCLSLAFIRPLPFFLPFFHLLLAFLHSSHSYYPGGLVLPIEWRTRIFASVKNSFSNNVPWHWGSGGLVLPIRRYSYLGGNDLKKPGLSLPSLRFVIDY